MLVINYQYIQLEYLETMTDGDADMMQTMLDMLIMEIPEEIEKMNVALAAQDWEELFQLSHKMKTTLSFIGNEEMIEANKTVEHNARHRENLDAVPALVAIVDDLGAKVVNELRQVGQ
jgi:HPt (histidine-containing phosphotransfer) domain-containing protein